jgi:tRNA-dihydrouridine synthase 1
LGAVKALKDTLGGRHAGVKVVSNGNVGTWDHIVRNREETGADGMMVGESILGNPWFVLFASLLSFASIALCSEIPLTDLLLQSIFENKTPDPVLISLEYLDLCKRYPETVTIANIRTHVRHFVEYQW